MIAAVAAWLLGVGQLGGRQATQPAPPQARTNIVLIVADDLGYADVGAHGATDISTPYIDSIAANGVRFTDAYVSCPVCAPTRAGLLTGREPAYGVDPARVADDALRLAGEIEAGRPGPPVEL